jgi:RNA polymerase-binding transcription factor DksA
MAKNTTTKKSSSKKTAKTSKGKSIVSKKKSTGKKATASAAKSSLRKPVSKKAVSVKTTDKKKIVAKTAKATKLKTTVKLKEKKITMPRKKKEKKTEVMKKPEISLADKQAEERAKAMQKIKGYSKKDLEHFKKIILDKRDEIIDQLQNLKEQMLDPTTGEYINENSPYSLHMAEQGTDAMEREKTFLYAQRENKFLGYLEDALKRIEAGTYGICIECIEEPQHLCETCPLIPKARLEAVPHSQLCVPIKQRQEKR